MARQLRHEHFRSVSQLNTAGLCGYYCGKPHTNIAVRMTVGDRIRSVFICDACWNQDHPDRVPVRVMHDEQPY